MRLIVDDDSVNAAAFICPSASGCQDTSGQMIDSDDAQKQQSPRTVYSNGF